MQHDTDCEVLIVGAGPVGLVAAIDLAQRGVDVVLVDRRENFDPLTVRCNHISSRSMEFFRGLGMSEAIRAAGFRDDFPHDVAIRTTATGKEMGRIRIPGRQERRAAVEGPDTWWPTLEPPHRMNQIFLEPVMLGIAQETNGLSMRFGHEVTSIAETDDRVRARLRLADGGMTSLSCRFLIGCDGGSSMVRRAIGAKFEGDAVVQRVQSSFIHAPGLTGRMQGREAWCILSINPRRPGTLYAIDNDDRFLVHNYLRPGEEFETLDRDQCLRTILGVDDRFDYDLIKVEDWIGRRLVADRIARNRIFLAGDSAHIWVPMGGYGMNAGIADAIGLTWLLDANLKGWGAPGMLSAYTAERLAITEQVSRFAMRTAEMMIRNRAAVPENIEAETPAGAASRAAYGARTRDLNTPQYCCAGLNYGYFYDASPIICYDGATAPPYSMDDYTPAAVPGCRMPHVMLPDGASLYDLLGPGYTLVRCGGAAKGDAMISAAQRAGMPLAVADIPSDPLFDRPLYLVRPDHHIAWRGEDGIANPELVIARLAGHY